MASFYYPFDSVNSDRKVSANSERRFWASMYSDGVIGADSLVPSVYQSGSKYYVSPGVAIVGGTIFGITEKTLVVLQFPGGGNETYITVRADNDSATRKAYLFETADMETDTTIDQINGGGHRDLPLFKVVKNGSGYDFHDLRTFATSYDAEVYEKRFSQLVDSIGAEGAARIEALSQNFQAAIDAANEENAGTYGAAGRQGFANPCFEVNQRGSEKYDLTSGSMYTYDRWLVRIGGAATTSAVKVTRAADGARTALAIANASYASGTGSASSCISQAIEHGVRRFCAGGKQFTVSFDAKCSSASGGKISVEPTQYAGGGQSAAIKAQTVTLTNSWKRYSLTFTGTASPIATADDMLKIAFFFAWRGYSSRFGADSNAAYTYYFANMQVNEGAKALPCYVRDYGDELERCQRYYARLGATSLSCGAVNSATKQVVTCPIPLTRRMRKAPAVTTADGAGVQGFASAETAAGSWRNGLAVSASDNSKEAPVLIVTNTDNAAITRVCCNSIVLDAEYYE